MGKIFDVVIPTKNNLSELMQCFDGLQKQTFKDFRVIVCVDGSTDGTIEFLEKINFDFRFLILKHFNNVNKGRDETRNLALPVLDSDYVLFIDSDMLPSDGLIKNHFELLKANDCISVGEVIYLDRNKNVWSHYLQTRGKGKYKHLQTMQSYYLNTQNVAFKTKYFVEIGGQDSDLSHSYGGDDTVLGYRLANNFKLPVIFNKKAVVSSKAEKTLEQALKQMEEFGSGNLKIIKKKYPELNKIFRLNLMDSDAIHHKIFKLLLTEYVSKIFFKLLKVSPSQLKLYIVQFLVFNYIYRGYISGNN